ncbi:MAG TPA: LapA family protein [Opitutaceae bacterium]|nr:LapA family protein [Opitutaceae bacterium]
MKLSWLFVIALLVFVAVFSVQNAEPITVRFLTWQFAMSAALVIQVAALLGAIVGLGCGAWSRRSSRQRERAEPKLPEPSPAPEPERSPIERHL